MQLHRLPYSGFLLAMHGTTQTVPTIGILDDQLIGAQDDIDIFLDLMGYEGQVERVLFDPTRAKFILDAGWSGKFWQKPSKIQVSGDKEFVVDTLGSRLPTKVSALAVLFIAAVEREGKRRVKAILMRPFHKTKKTT